MSQDRQAAFEMVRRTGQQGVPVIAVGDQYIVGFDQPRIEQALARADSAQPAFGASVADVSSASIRRPGLPAAGAYVGRVKQGSPAERAGLAAGDVIVELDGRPIRTAAELETAIQGRVPGSSVSIAYERHGERRMAQAQL